MKQKNHEENKLRFIDFMIIIICLSVMAYSINLFRLDLFQTIKLHNVQPIGAIMVIDNIVQRRVADRVLWDRPAAESPVYPGDLIRAADLSSATIDMAGQRIDLGENTLIRIQPVTDKSDIVQIELVEGNLDVALPAEGGGLQLNLMGRVVEISAGTTLTASAGKDGLAVQVNEGTAAFIEKGGNREISSGTMITLDQEGAEKIQSVAIAPEPLEPVIELKPESELKPQSEPELKPEPKPEPAPKPKTLLPAPGGRQPANRHRIDIEQLKTQRNITFRWSTVPGANAYIFTLYEQTEKGRRQINRVTVVRPTWTLEDISVLNRGDFIWQVEAVNRNAGGVIEQRGSTGENTFIMDIPLPRPVQMENPGVLYDR